MSTVSPIGPSPILGDLNPPYNIYDIKDYYIRYVINVLFRKRLIKRYEALLNLNRNRNRY